MVVVACSNMVYVLLPQSQHCVGRRELQGVEQLPRMLCLDWDGALEHGSRVSVESGSAQGTHIKCFVLG